MADQLVLVAMERMKSITGASQRLRPVLTKCHSEDTGFGRERSIAIPIGANGEDRVLRTVGSPAWVAKNRFSLPPEIPLAWDSFAEGLAH